MKAVVLVGGEGTRLRPLTLTTPKPLLPIANRAFLERQLAWLEHHGVDEVVLSLGYLPDAFREHFPEGRCGGVRLRYAVEDQPLGTAGGIRFAAEGIDERFLVCNGDVLTDLDLGEVLAFHDSAQAEATIALTRVEDPSAFGVVPTRADGSVVAFVEKPPRGSAPTDWINAGTYVLEPSVLDHIPPRLQVSIEREIFPRMLEATGRLFAVRSGAYWLDIGTPDKYRQAHDDVLAGRLGLPPVTGAVEVEPDIWLEGEAVVEPGAVLEAPVLVGRRARVEAGAIVARSVVGPEAVVEAEARVAHSVLLAGAHAGYGATVVDSVVGVDAVLKPESTCIDDTIVGSGVTVAAASRVAGGRLAVTTG